MNKYTNEKISILFSGRKFNIEHGCTTYPYNCEIVADTYIICKNGNHYCNVEIVTPSFLKVYTIIMGKVCKVNVSLNAIVFEPHE